MSQGTPDAGQALLATGPVAEARQTRIAQLAAALGRPLPGRAVGTVGEFGAQLLEVIDPRDHTQVWLALATMRGLLPTDEEVIEVARESEFDGGLALAAGVVRALQPANARLLVTIPEPGSVLVDVTTTLAVPYMTGIQRVVRETTPRWATLGAAPVVWIPGGVGMRAPLAHEVAALEQKRPVGEVVEIPEVTGFIVPWRCTFITAEAFSDVARADRTRGVARFARTRTAAVVHDCSPVTLGETRTDWPTDPFVFYLSALAHFDQLVADSVATKEELLGWRLALSATGVEGPEVNEVMLPAEILPAGEDCLTASRELLLASEGPVVGVVGSREPRKNHLAVLHAAEIVWRRGHAFRLVFLGGRAWEASEFGDEVARLRAAGRPIDIVSNLSDEQMAAAYQVSRFTLFPSLSEGFGLPVAESLVLGTPVITSNYGSVREIAEAGGGALLVDPRDDHAIADAIECLLTDDVLLDRLRDEAKARPPRTWDTYCREAWGLLTGDA